MKNILDAITKAAPSLVKGGFAIVNAIIEGINTLLPAVINLGIILLENIITGLEDGETIQNVSATVGLLVAAIISHIDDLTILGIRLAAAIAEGILVSLPVLLESVAQGFIDLYTECDFFGGVIITVTSAVAAFLIVINMSTILDIVSLAMIWLEFTISGCSVSFAAFTTVLLANPIGLIVAGVTALITVIILLIANWDDVTKACSGFFDLLSTIGTAIIDGMISGLSDFGKKTWEAIVGGFNWLVEQICAFFGIHSPSTMFADFGVNMIQGLIDGILGAGPSIWGKIKGVFTDIIDNIMDVMTGKDTGNSVIDGVTSGLKSAGKAISSGAKSVAKFLGFAGGTDFAPGGPTWVGENGPELINLPRGAEVLTNTESMGMVNASKIASRTASSYGSTSAAMQQINLNLTMDGKVNLDGSLLGRVIFNRMDSLVRSAYG